MAMLDTAPKASLEGPAGALAAEAEALASSSSAITAPLLISAISPLKNPASKD